MVSDDYKNLKLSRYVGDENRSIYWKCFYKIVFWVTLIFLNNYTNFTLMSHYGSKFRTIDILNIFILILIYTVFNLMLEYFFDYRLMHSYKIIESNSLNWLNYRILDTFLSLMFDLLFLFIIVYLLRAKVKIWWIYAGILGNMYYVFASYIFPNIITVNFKIKPYRENELKKKILDLIKENNINMNNIYEVDYSSLSSQSNAAVVGMGRNLKILLSSNIESAFTQDEIISTVAHEIGHIINKHLEKEVIINVIINFGGCYIFAQTYNLFVNICNNVGFDNVNLVIFLYLSWKLSSIFIIPIELYFSRQMERQADYFVLHSIKYPKHYINVIKRRLLDEFEDPSPFFFKYIFSYSHPTLTERIKYLYREIEKK